VPVGAVESLRAHLASLEIDHRPVERGLVALDPVGVEAEVTEA
jgi:hypothetical protein